LEVVEMKKKNQTQKTFMVVTALVIFILLVNFVVANWHCCKPEGCHDCVDDFLGCNCELREKLGMQVCDDCKESGCGNEHQGNMCSGG